MKMEVYDFEPINYEEEFNNFCEVTALNISKFQKTNQDLDETVFNSDVVSNTNKLNEALQSLIDAKSQKEKILSNVSNDDVNIRDIQKDIAEILKRNEEASNNISQVNEAVAKKKQELSSKRNQTSSSKDIFEEKKSKIHLELEKWKKALGLELIISTHNSLIFKFSNIVRDDPEKTFTCEIKVEEGKYEVINCSPRIKDLESMLEILNKTNDLSGFVVTLRRRFTTMN